MTTIHQQPVEPEDFKPLLKQKIKPKTDNHAAYLQSMKSNVITFCLGPAGGGKTYIAAGHAAQLLANGDIDKIVFCRPMVQAGPVDEVGFLPGDMNSKAGPFMAPLTDAMGDFFSTSDLKELSERGIISLLPISMMRGKSLRRSFVIVDEAQNCSVSQVRLVLTRIEPGCKIVVAGDDSQCDINRSRTLSEISDWLVRTKPVIPNIGRINFTHDDNQRDPLVALIDQRLAVFI